MTTLLSAEAEHLVNTTIFASRLSEFVEKYGSTALRFYLQAVSRELLPNERITVCWRYPIPNHNQVEIIYSQERKRARSRGTMKCGRAWICPVCAYYMAERRRVELLAALDKSRSFAGVVLVTYTARHDFRTRLVDQIQGMAEAYRVMRAGRAWQTLKEEYALIGSAKTLEITYGENGWHPHFHELLFFELSHLTEYTNGQIQPYAASLETQLRRAWCEALNGQGLSAVATIGLTVRCTNRDVAEYVTKFGKMPSETLKDGLEMELAYGSRKTQNRGHFDALTLLFGAGEGDERCKKLVLEYAEATKGRSWVRWSREIKARLELDIIRDELAAEGVQTETDVILATVNFDVWKWCAAQGYLGQIMTYANSGDAEKLNALLDQLAEIRQGVLS